MNLLYIALSIVIGVIAILVFLKDFDLFDKRTLGILFGLSAIGGFLSISFLKRRSFLRELKLRKEQVEHYKKVYANLLAKNMIQLSEYENLMAKVASIEKGAYLSIFKASNDYPEKTLDLERYRGLEAHELYEKVVETVNS